MSWLQKLHQTYDVCSQRSDFTDPPQCAGEKEIPALMPVSHTSQQAHIEVVLDEKGNFLEAALLPQKAQFVIPATENSAGRTAGNVPHPLADKLHYCAKDYAGGKENQFQLYAAQLEAWCASAYSHPKARAVYAYVSRGTLVHDLLQKGILHADSSGSLLTEAPTDDQDSIFKRLTPKKVGTATARDQGDALVIWSIQSQGDTEPRTWRDKSLQNAWIAYDASQMQLKALCMIEGKEASIAAKHPRNIRRPGDGAKLISSNDTSGFSFRGRFLVAEEACTVAYETSHKAHNALRWLIGRQGYRNDDQVVLAWAVDGIIPPSPAMWIPPDEPDFLFTTEEGSPDASTSPEELLYQDVGQHFAHRLKRTLRGYREHFGQTDGIAVLALDAASPGRLSVTFYREQLAGEYLDRLEQWQQDASWLLPLRKETTETDKSKAKKRPRVASYAPLPDTIAEVAYGRRIDGKLRKATVERLLPCIVDGAPIPRDIVESCTRRACNRTSLEEWEWPGVLGTACAVYKGFYARHPHAEERRMYTMSLDKERRTRDYLYGRLLAVAEYVERNALNEAEKNRPTNAERLMQRFADHPYSTWRNLEKHIAPYMQRLQSNKGSLWRYDKARRTLQEICDSVADIDDFASPRKLEGEFLLGYHCQYAAFYTDSKKNNTEVTETEGA